MTFFTDLEASFNISAAQSRMNTLVVSSIHANTKVINTCAPKSLQVWQKRNNIKNKKMKYCDVDVQEVSARFKLFKDLTNIHKYIFFRNHWDTLDKKLKRDKIVKKYKKVTIALRSLLSDFFIHKYFRVFVPRLCV